MSQAMLCGRYAVDMTLERTIVRLIASIWLVLFGALVVIPFLMVVGMSWLERDYGGGVILRASGDAWRQIGTVQTAVVVVRSLTLAVLTTVGCLIIGMPGAFAIYLGKPRTKRILLGLFTVPVALNALLVAFSWHAALGAAGPVSRVLTFLSGERVSLLFHPATVVVGCVGTYLPFFLITFAVALERIDRTFLVASASLGASPADTFRHVILPMARAGLTVAAIFVFVPVFSEYVLPDLLGGGKLLLVGNLSAFAFYEGRDWPFGAAVTVVSVLLLAGVAAPFLREFQRVAGLENDGKARP
jgi:spermidine/putrescine transport system permease protein